MIHKQDVYLHLRSKMSTLKDMMSLHLQISNKETRNVKHTEIINFACEIVKQMDSYERWRLFCQQVQILSIHSLRGTKPVIPWRLIGNKHGV